MLVLLPSNMVASKAEDYYFKGQDFFKAKNYKNAGIWYERSYRLKKDKDTAFNIGVSYDEIGEFDNAITWYKKAVDMGQSDAALNLGFIYKKIRKNHKKAIKYYKKSYEMGNIGGASNLGLLYDVIKKDYKKAIHWYMIGVRKSDFYSIKNLANLYRDQGEKVKAGAYIIGLLALKPKKKTKYLNYLKTKWKLSDVEIKDAYELQKTLLPQPYLGGI